MWTELRFAACFELLHLLLWILPKDAEESRDWFEFLRHIPSPKVKRSPST